MLNVWLGALLVIAGLLYMAAQPIWRGRLSGRREKSEVEEATVEPRKRGVGFGLKANWPGLAMVVLGVLLLLFEALSGTRDVPA